MTAPAAGPAGSSSPNSGVRSVHTPNTGGQKRAMSYGPPSRNGSHAAKTVKAAKPSSTRKGKR